MWTVMRILALFGFLMTRKRKHDDSPSGGKKSARTQLTDARASLQPVRQRDGSGSNSGNNTNTPNRKTPQQMRNDAQAIAEGFRTGKNDQQANMNYNGKTVVTIQDADGNKYYTVSSNNTSPEARRIAAELGYTRISGSQYIAKVKNGDPADQWHAEHIAINAKDAGKMTPPIDISPHRRPCDSYGNSNNQGCGDRAANDPDVNLVGW